MERPIKNHGDAEEEEELCLLEKYEKKQVDGGLGWLVVFACFLTTFVLDGIGYSFGMFMKPLMHEMKESNFGVASIGSVQVRPEATTNLVNLVKIVFRQQCISPVVLLWQDLLLSLVPDLCA